MGNGASVVSITIGGGSTRTRSNIRKDILGVSVLTARGLIQVKATVTLVRVRMVKCKAVAMEIGISVWDVDMRAWEDPGWGVWGVEGMAEDSKHRVTKVIREGEGAGKGGEW